MGLVPTPDHALKLDVFWQSFVAENILFYTTLLRLLLPRSARHPYRTGTWYLPTLQFSAVDPTLLLSDPDPTQLVFEEAFLNCSLQLQFLGCRSICKAHLFLKDAPVLETTPWYLPTYLPTKYTEDFILFVY